jgi:hypothetical protein
MIYSRFGTKLTLLSKDTDEAGQVRIQATTEGMEGVRDFRRSDLMADDGPPEIDAAIAQLQPKKTRS